MAEDINLKNLTQMELLELRHNLEHELQTYSQREKKPAFTINLRGLSTRYFSKRDNAHKLILEMVEDEELFDKNYDVECSIEFLTTEEWKRLCEDIEK